MAHEDDLIKLVYETQRGNLQAKTKLILKISPLIKKYSYSLGYNFDEGIQDLTCYIIEAIMRYKPKI